MGTMETTISKQDLDKISVVMGIKLAGNFRTPGVLDWIKERGYPSNSFDDIPKVLAEADAKLTPECRYVLDKFVEASKMREEAA
jgi:hypothetical protein